MPKVRSLTGHSELVRRWKIYPDGRVEDPQGNIHDTAPVEIAFSPQCMALVGVGAVEIEELKTAKKEELLKSFPKVEKATEGAQVLDAKAGVLRKKR